MTEILRSISPADPGDEIGSFPVADASAVATAVSLARRAFPAWRDAGFEARAKAIMRFRDQVAGRRNEIAKLIAREVGKAHWEAKGEAALLPAKVDVTLTDGMALVSPVSPAPGVRADYHPRGVMAVLGPFNFPAHLPNGHIVPALAAGNTLVFKPSELTPAVGDWMLEAWRQAGLPEDVLTVVQGGADTGRALAVHDDVDGVLFTGSWAVGRALKEATLDQPGKLLALEMGGKNAMIVLADANLDLAVSETALSICATTGQRCSCTSRIFVEESILDAFTEKLQTVLAGVRIGSPFEEGVFMGPLVSGNAFDKLARFRALASEAGGERLLDGVVSLPAPFTGPGLVRFSSTRQEHPYQREEIFGPEAALYPVADLDEAIHAVNDSEYGLVASVMTGDRGSYEHCVGRVRTGLLNWNRGTIGANGRLPFGGLGRSGNDRPAGVTAALYCTVPQARLESEAGFDPEGLPPGMPRP